MMNKISNIIAISLYKALVIMTVKVKFQLKKIRTKKMLSKHQLPLLSTLKFPDLKVHK